MAQTHTNRFALLDPEESLDSKHEAEPITSPLLALPRELRDIIYTFAIHDDDGTTRLKVSKSHDNHKSRNPRKHKVKGPYALLYVNRQLCREFFEALEEYVPHHFKLDVKAYLNTCQPFERNVAAQYQHLDDLSPSAAKRIDISTSFYLEVEAIAGEHWIPPGKLDMLVISLNAFNNSNKQLLVGCGNVQELCLQLSTLAHLAQHADTDHGDPNLIFESLVQVVEALPKLLRYAVRVGMEGTYARRKSTEEAWHSTRVVRFVREHMPDEAAGGWAELYHDLNVVSRLDRVHW